jgi:hypothetical protein
MKTLLTMLLAVSFSNLSLANIETEPLVVQCEMVLKYRFAGREAFVSGKWITTEGTTSSPISTKSTSVKLYNPEAQVDYTALGAKNKLKKVCSEEFKAVLSNVHFLLDENIDHGPYEQYQILSVLMTSRQGNSKLLKEMLIMENEGSPQDIWLVIDRNQKVEEFCREAVNNKLVVACEVQPQTKE